MMTRVIKSDLTTVLGGGGGGCERLTMDATYSFNSLRMSLQICSISNIPYPATAAVLMKVGM